MNDMTTVAANQVAPYDYETAAFELLQRKAKALANSTIFPERFRKNIGDCIIVMEMAERLKASPLMVAQNLYVVHGSPAWSAKFIISCVNACGRFEPLRYEEIGSDPNDKGYRIRAWTSAKGDSTKLYGPWIDWAMVKAEKWDGKSGSKWLSLPGLMFRYRAASWWAATTAPELTMGLRTVEEQEEITDIAYREVSPKQSAAALVNAKIKQIAQADPDVTVDDDKDPESTEGALTFAQVNDMLSKATDVDTIEMAAESIGAVDNPQHRKELSQIASERLASFTTQEQ